MTLDVRHARVIQGLRSIHATSYRAAEDALTEARSRGALVELDRLWIVNAVVAEVDPSWIERLEADPAVAGILPDRRITLGSAAAGPVLADVTAAQPVDDLIRIRVPEAWALGLTGRGAIVANVDSGVNGEDDTFGDRWRGRLAGSDATWFAPVSLSVFPEDDFSIGSGHGTATMGVLTGGSETYGVAFDATWIAADVFQEGEGYVSNVLKSFGIRKGDRIALYMPLVPELAIAMLACARIGAVHSIVFGGFSAEALRDRINDAQARLLVTADGSPASTVPSSSMSSHTVRPARPASPTSALPSPSASSVTRTKSE